MEIIKDLRFPTTADLIQVCTVAKIYQPKVVRDFNRTSPSDNTNRGLSRLFFGPGTIVFTIGHFSGLRGGKLELRRRWY